MCGFVGYLTKKNKLEEDTLLKMSSQIAHRGPDDSGIWIDKKDGIGMAHRRLSIIDLSSAGHQPMFSLNNRYVLTFNGEIYNHKAIRKLIEKNNIGYPWRGNSDTETLISSIQYFGIKESLEKINGMFAFACWDKDEKKLFLARDRFGEKPLYYSLFNNLFIFGSELKSFYVHPEWEPKIENEVLCSFLRFGYIPAPNSIFKKVYKVQPGTFLEFDYEKMTIINEKSYWNIQEIAEKEKNNIKNISFYERTRKLEKKLCESINLRMDSDVPIGAFLSGGIDSSTIVALMQKQSSKPINTFTIGFNKSDFNEAKNAKKISSYLGTNHNELYLSSKDALKVIPEIPNIWDEPFADSSQIPTLILSRFAKKDITVAISGDGGDEVFGGYDRYGQGYKINQLIQKLPKAFLPIIKKALLIMPVSKVDRLIRIISLNKYDSRVGDRIQKLGEIIGYSKNYNFYKQFMSHIRNPSTFIKYSEEIKTKLDNEEDLPKLNDFREVMMILDTLTYLPGDILTKVDRASMDASLEVRVPFLDHKLVEWMWQQPLSFKISANKTKFALREILSNHLPNSLIDLPKKGFSIPMDYWLKGPLKEWAEDLIYSEKVYKQDLLKSEPILKMWNEHQSGQRKWHYQLWNLLMFISWYEKWH
tara:strand:- start:6281 stop:8215 length:1935 start_codon:yes stop_codon:yes gene_type:complete